MKIRNGFVSNSSTSSFCIMGIEKDIDEYALMLGRDPAVSIEDEEGYVTYAEIIIYDEIESRFKRTEAPLAVVGYPFDGGPDWAVGVLAEDLPEDQTIAQLREWVAEQLSTIFDSPISSDEVKWRMVTYHS